MKAVSFKGALFFLGFFLLVPTPSLAQEPCGSIVERYDDGEGGITEYATSIEDCSNPFGILNENQNLEVSFGSTHILGGGSYPFLGVSDTITATGTHPQAFFVWFELYKKIPEGYLRINEDDLGNYTFIETGSYTLVVHEDEEPILTQNLLRKFLDFLIPTAYAFPGVSLALTFEVTAPPQEPTGISNILFLPGIQASRLYIEINGEEEKLWEPGGDDEVRQLAMTNVGESVNEIYTKDVVDELPGGANVYKGFLEFLEDMDGEQGPMVRAFPYDWRQDVFDIVENGTKDDTGLMKSPVATVEYLATLSPTDKVTLVAHSNGGLLAKAIMLKLEEEGKADLVDKVIFIASPHIGTPKAIAALLHGFDQGHLWGLISSAEAVRSVMRNMPGVYGLLPSETYVGSLTEPMISFDDSGTTELYRNAYGFTVSNMTEYTNFMKGTEGRAEAGDTIEEPPKANSAMLDDALSAHRDQLDNWEASPGVEVYNIVGTGLPTPKSIEYREFMQTQCNEDRSVCVPAPKIEPRLYLSRQGDKTVVVKSASVSENSLYMDMFPMSGFDHGNITEAVTTQALIDHILHGSSTDDIAYVTSSEPAFSNDDLDVLEVHSPARIYIRDSEGNVTGKTELGESKLEEVPGSSYFEFGGGKYLLVPSELEYEVVIEGEGSGFYTHIASTLGSETQEELHEFTATVTPEMVATYEKTEDDFSEVSVDVDGDGEVDSEMTLEGEIIDDSVTYGDLTSAVRVLELPRLHERYLLGLTEYAKWMFEHRGEKKWNERLEEGTLTLMQKSLKQFKKSKLITGEEYEEIVSIIQKLIEQ